LGKNVDKKFQIAKYHLVSHEESTVTQLFYPIPSR